MLDSSTAWDLEQEKFHAELHDSPVTEQQARTCAPWLDLYDEIKKPPTRLKVCKVAGLGQITQEY